MNFLKPVLLGMLMTQAASSFSQQNGAADNLTSAQALAAAEVGSSLEKWQSGVVKQEFLYDKAPFPSCHSATLAETPFGLVASFFGGTKERNPDVEIYISRYLNGKWLAPVSVANGIQPDGKRLPTWNPVLYQIPGGDL